MNHDPANAPHVTMKRFSSLLPAIPVFWIVLWPLSANANAPCKRMWDTAEVARSGESVLAAIPFRWFLGIDIVRRRIDEQSGIETRLFLCEASEPNAFAWRAGGRDLTAVTTGMYLLLGDDWHAYAAIIGHENAHHVRRHIVKRMVRGVALNAIANATEATTLAALGLQAVGATFSRTEETEADRYGLRYALCAGFSSGGAFTFFEKMKTASSFLHSHPSSKSRIRALQVIADSYKRDSRCR